MTKLKKYSFVVENFLYLCVEKWFQVCECKMRRVAISNLSPGFLMVEWREPVIAGENRRGECGEQRVEKESGRHVEREKERRVR